MTPPTTLPQLTLHPSLEIKAGVALVGFRYRASVKHERVIYVIATNGRIHYEHDNVFSLGDQQYVVERVVISMLCCAHDSVLLLTQNRNHDMGGQREL